MGSLSRPENLALSAAILTIFEEKGRHEKQPEQDRLEFRVLGKAEPAETGQLSWEYSSY